MRANENCLACWPWNDDEWVKKSESLDVVCWIESEQTARRDDGTKVELNQLTPDYVVFNWFLLFVRRWIFWFCFDLP